MNYILEDDPKMPYYTDMRQIFKSFNGLEKNYNWLITNLECNSYNSIWVGKKKVLWIDGKTLSDRVFKEEIQFIWAVFSGFNKNIEIDVNKLEIEPYADGNPNFWVANPKIQHPLASVEIVCFDSSLTLLLSKDDELGKRFSEYFKGAKILENYNSKTS